MVRKGRIWRLFEHIQGLESDWEDIIEHGQKVHGRRAWYFECEGSTETDGSDTRVKCVKGVELHDLWMGQERQRPTRPEPLKRSL